MQNRLMTSMAAAAFSSRTIMEGMRVVVMMRLPNTSSMSSKS